MRSDLRQKSYILELNAVAVELTELPALNAIFLLRGIVGSAFHYPKVDSNTFKITWLFVIDCVVAQVLKDANYIRVRSVDLRAKKVPADEGFVKSG